MTSSEVFENMLVGNVKYLENQDKIATILVQGLVQAHLRPSLAKRTKREIYLSQFSNKTNSSPCRL